MNPEVQQRVGETKVVTTAIKLIIDNKSKAKNVIQQVGDKEAANIFENAYSGIVKELKSLLEWWEVHVNDVDDEAYRGLVEASVKKGRAGQVKVSVKEGINLLV